MPTASPADENLSTRGTCSLRSEGAMPLVDLLGEFVLHKGESPQGPTTIFSGVHPVSTSNDLSAWLQDLIKLHAPAQLIHQPTNACITLSLQEDLT